MRNAEVRRLRLRQRESRSPALRAGSAPEDDRRRERDRSEDEEVEEGQRQVEGVRGQRAEQRRRQPPGERAEASGLRIARRRQRATDSPRDAQAVEDVEEER